MIALDIATEYPALHTRPFVVSEAEPEDVPLKGGLVVDVGVWDVASGKLGFTGGVRGWGASWDRTVDFEARVWNGEFDVSYRLTGKPTDALVQGWWGVAGGLRFGVLQVDWWEDVATFGVGGWTGGGILIGRGPVRASLSGRLGVSLDTDKWTGTVAASDETTTWSYWPGSVRISVVTGVAFR